MPIGHTAAEDVLFVFGFLGVDESVDGAISASKDAVGILCLALE